MRAPRSRLRVAPSTCCSCPSLPSPSASSAASAGTPLGRRLASLLLEEAADCASPSSSSLSLSSSSSRISTLRFTLKLWFSIKSTSRTASGSVASFRRRAILLACSSILS
eukprot:tig00021127_g18787.t1